MKPTLFHIGSEAVPAYFTLLLIGFGLAIYLGARTTERRGYDREVFIDLGLFSLIMGVAGGRVLHVIADGYFWDYVHLCTDPSKVAWPVLEAQCAGIGGAWDAAAAVCRPTQRNCFAWAEFWNGGLAYYGGLFAAVAFGVWFLKRERFPVLEGLDLAGMVIPLGLFFGRIGCFLGGCCFGQPFEGLFAVRFPVGSAASQAQFKAHLLASPQLESLSVYPTQLYEAGGSLLIAALMMLVVAPRKRFDGQVMLAFLGLYSVLRFAIEFVRADDRGALLGLSTSQFLGLVIIAACAFAWRKLAARARAGLAAA
jgi:phosphatidylglycerol:prolipoprotein diacylglycerol transferase